MQPAQGLSPEAAVGRGSGGQAAREHLRSNPNFECVSPQRTRGPWTSSLFTVPPPKFQGLGDEVDNHCEGLKETVEHPLHPWGFRQPHGSLRMEKAPLEPELSPRSVGPGVLWGTLSVSELFSDLDMAGGPKPSPAQLGQKKQRGTAICW